MFRQRKSIIFFCLLTIILMLVPAIMLNLIRFPDDGDRYYPPYWRPWAFGQDDMPYSQWVMGASAGRLQYWPIQDASNGGFGHVDANQSSLNSQLYHGVLGQLPQKLYAYSRSGFGCTPRIFPGIRNTNFSTLFTYPVAGGEAEMAEFITYWNNNYCYDTTSSVGIRVRDAQIDDATQPFKFDGSFVARDSYEADFPYILKSAYYVKALNYTYSETDLNPYGSQRNTPLLVVTKFFSLPTPTSVGAPKMGFPLTFYWIFAMLVLNFLTPLFTQRLVLERSEGLVDIAMMMGLNRLAHWAGHLTLDVALYFFFVILVYVIAFASNVTIGLAMISPWVIFSCIIFCFTTLSVSYLISFAFRSPRTCLIMSYIYCLVLFAIAAICNILLVTPGSNLPAYVIWWPPLAFFRLTYLGLLRWALPSSESGFSSLLSAPLRDAMLCLVFETIVIIIIVLLLDRFAPTKLGNRGTTWNMITDFVTNLYRRIRDRSKKSADGTASYRNLDSAEELLLENNHVVEDARVVAERNAVLNGQIENPVMLINRVTKVYAEGTKKFTALGGVTFSLQGGDCFGLLGPNGAGKSTLVAIMSGILTPTSGGVTIAKSHDRCAIGLCPQDDIFYADLTVEEHLLYYSRLKGKGRGEDQAAVDRILADVSMANERRLYAASLSGGQKRRLSVASALCGDPMVVFLDEPSSSLDPGSRIGLWEIIQAISKTRCTLLTTHSMEEAEVLCNKIGIIKDGMMVCLGTSAQLKNAYGQGYKLLVSMNAPHTIQPVLDEVLKVASDATLVSSKHGHYQIRLGVNATLSTVSQVMEHNRRTLGVAQWSLARNGLDEVFLSIVEDRGVRPKNDNYGAIDADENSPSDHDHVEMLV